jgi:hypothetical protein
MDIDRDSQSPKPLESFFGVSIFKIHQDVLDDEQCQLRRIPSHGGDVFDEENFWSAKSGDGDLVFSGLKWTLSGDRRWSWFTLSREVLAGGTFGVPKDAA